MQEIEFNWKTSDNLTIYAKEWKVKNPRAVICIVHGLGEHCNRYNHLAAYFAAQHMALLAYDRRGHGKSEGKRGRTRSYNDFLDEVAELLSHTIDRYEETPIFLYGHSMGGNIAMNYALRRHPTIKGLIATGPWIKLPEEPSYLLVMVATVLNKLTGGFAQSNGLDAKVISKDPAVVKRYVDDPLVHDRIGSKAGIETHKAGQWLFNYRGTTKIPMLLMHASEDKATSPEGTRHFVANVDGDITHKEWEGMYHEIHNEPDQLEVFKYTLDWINRHL